MAARSDLVALSQHLAALAYLREPHTKAALASRLSLSERATSRVLQTLRSAQLVAPVTSCRGGRGQRALYVAIVRIVPVRQPLSGT